MNVSSDFNMIWERPFYPTNNLKTNRSHICRFGTWKMTKEEYKLEHDDLNFPKMVSHADFAVERVCSR